MSQLPLLKLSAAGLTDPGLRRQTNEDAWSGPPPNLTPEQVATKGLLYLVADGVGGHRGGDVASQMAVQMVQQLYYADPNPDVAASLTAAIQEANRRIYHQGISQPEQFGMSTTLTAAVIRGNDLFIANVGDSRTYLLRNGQAHQMTVDHTWVEERRRAGLLTDQEAANHPQRNVITRSLGNALEVQVDVFGPHRLMPGDRILLCTDGLSDLLSDAEMAAVGSGTADLASAVRRMVHLARQRGAPDNVTAVLVSTDGVARPAPSLLPVVGTVAALVVMGMALLVTWRLRQNLPALSVAPGAPAQATSPSPTFTPSPTPTASPTPMPPLTLTGPADNAVFIYGQKIVLTWSGPSLTERQRFVVKIDGMEWEQRGPIPGPTISFTLPQQLAAGTYTWMVRLEEERDGKWEEMARSGERHFRVIEPSPTSTPTPTPPTPPPPPQEGGGGGGGGGGGDEGGGKGKEN
jgi:serine/threonine protein phosphatase PrpC